MEPKIGDSVEITLPRHLRGERGKIKEARHRKGAGARYIIELMFGELQGHEILEAKYPHDFKLVSESPSCKSNPSSALG
jgi:hypothetical protein